MATPARFELACSGGNLYVLYLHKLPILTKKAYFMVFISSYTIIYNL
ncbi:hypothetical protein ABLL_1337 [Arcobacter sp. L]|nr:hypothetical protein ABLL_1337 [Arcobacter sp. L]